MKKGFLILMVFSLMLSCVSAQAEEIMLETTSSSGFSFDLDFELFPDSFSLKKESGLRGYSDLLNHLHIQGTAYFSDGGESFDEKSIEIEGTVVPVSRLDAGISFRLEGLPSHLVLSTPLLGEEKLFFNNLALTEFALKTYVRFNILRPWFVSCFPYCIRKALAEIHSAWARNTGPVSRAADLAPDQCSQLVSSLSGLLEEDQYLRKWLTCLSVGSEFSGVLEQELAALPDYLQRLLADHPSVHVEKTESEEVWSTTADGILFRSETAGALFRFETTLPATDSGFVPEMGFSSETNPQGTAEKTTLRIRYARESSDDPLILLDLAAEFSRPAVWPQENSFTAEILQTGVLLPQINLKAELHAEQSGAFRLSVRDASVTGQSVLLNISGTIQPVSSRPISVYTVPWAIQYMNFFSVGDSNLEEFVSNTARSLFQSGLPFAAEIPASFYQELLDDLTDSGLFRLLLGE